MLDRLRKIDWKRPGWIMVAMWFSGFIFACVIGVVWAIVLFGIITSVRAYTVIKGDGS